ncbi:hypothetical protein HY095_00130 [Candidatus Micrarchaeota archaeon]|nr:hypothetical protein [Candidatus Micrarchaeota archaeon]
MARRDEPQGLYSEAGGRQKRVIAKPVEVPGGWFVPFTKRLGKSFRSFGRGSKFSPEQQQAIDFLRWDVDGQDVYGIYKGIIFGGVAIAILLSLIVYLQQEDILFAGAAGGFVAIAALGLSYAYLTTPTRTADDERKQAIAYIPEIVNYLVMNMRLSPNLEKAVEFAATHGRGKIADDLRKLIWDVQIGVHSSVEEGLDDLAYRWGAYNDDFKHALMLIRASLLEGEEAKREEMLARASADVLEGSKEKMDVYARQLHQPTVYLYYFGILLPLMLAIVLPIASGVVKGLPLQGVLPFILIYDVGLPLFVYVFAKSIIGSRPPTYVPPEIPENFPGLPPSWAVQIGRFRFPYLPLALGLVALSLFAGVVLDQQAIDATKGNLAILETDKAVDAIPHVVIPFIDLKVYSFTIFGALVGLSLFVSIYLLGKYRARKKMQDEVRSMEVEFKDAMYVLASRLGENRPMEDALKHSIEFLPKSAVANRIFRRVLDNITQLGMTMDGAIFDPNYGAIRDIPSDVIRGGMRIMVDSVQLGVNVAAISLINLAMQIRNAQKIDEMLKRLLEDVTTMLKTMGTFIAPIVLAVVTSLQRVILNSLTSNCGDSASQAVSSTASQAAGGALGNTGIAQVFCNIDPKTTVSTGEFTLVMGVYVLEIVVLLTYFNSQIEDSNNKLHSYVSIAYSMPVAAALFSIVAYLAGSFLAGAGG